METWLAPIIAFLKSGWTPALTAFFALTVALWGPQWLLSNLGVANLIATHREWIGVAWLISASLVAAKLVVVLSLKLGQVFRDKQAIARTRKQIEKLIETLTDDERTILRKFDSEKRSAVNLPLDGISVRLLIGKKILVLVPGVISMNAERAGFRGRDYRVADDIGDYLQEEIRRNPTLLDPKPKA
jgi:hypothetical protein